MTKICRAVIAIPAIDPTLDQSSFSFTFNSDTAVDFSNTSALLTALSSFVNAAGTGGTNALSHYLSPALSHATNAGQIELYDITGHLNGTPHGSPVAISNFTVGTPGAVNGYPEGVAATVSFRADYGTDVEFGALTGHGTGRQRPRARDRNRVYVGPLNSNAFTNDATTQRSKFTSGFITDCLAALFNLSQSHTTGTDTWVLRVWTRVGAAIKLPTTGYMDDRPDYQRRRSDPNPGARVSRALASV